MFGAAVRNHSLQGRPRHRKRDGGSGHRALGLFQNGGFMTAMRILGYLLTVLFFLALPLRAAQGPADADRGRLVWGLQAAYGAENDIPHNPDNSHIKMLYAQPQIGMVLWNSPTSRLPVK